MTMTSASRDLPARDSSYYRVGGNRYPGREIRMSVDTDKIDELTLALMHLVTHRQRSKGPLRAWKGFDWDTLDRLHEKGMIGDPVGKAKSVIMTEEGARRARELFQEHFVVDEEEDTSSQTSDPAPPEVSNVVELNARGSATYLDDPLLEGESLVNEADLEPIEMAPDNPLTLEDFVAGHGPEGQIYLDTETGEFFWFADLEPPPPIDADPDKLSDWRRSEWERNVAVQNDTDDRFLQIETPESRDDWQDMSDFASLLIDTDVAEAIHDAIDGKGAFGRFRRILDRVDGLEEAWNSFKEDRTRYRARMWLADHGYTRGES